MPTATGTFQFPSVIPGFFFLLFSKEVEEGRGDKESNTIDFFFKEMVYIYICICLCVYVFCVLFCHDLNIFFPPKFAVIFSPEGAFWLL